MKTINWNATKEDTILISKIVKRIQEKSVGQFRPMDLDMDITACHLNGCPLKLEELLLADDFNLFHDIAGISNHIDRRTGKLTDCFVPRFAQ